MNIMRKSEKAIPGATGLESSTNDARNRLARRRIRPHTRRRKNEVGDPKTNADEPDDDSADEASGAES